MGEEVVRRMARADIDAVVRVHAEAFPAHFLTSLGRPFLRTYYACLLGDEAAWALSAALDGEVVGFVVGSPDPSGFYRRLLRRRSGAFAVAAARGVARRPSGVRRLVRAFSQPGRQEPGADVAGLFSLGVTPSRQGRGVGAALLASFIDLARDAGARCVALETDADGNEGVCAFYEAHAFRAVDHWSTPEGRRMVRYRLAVHSPDTASGGRRPSPSAT